MLYVSVALLIAIVRPYKEVCMNIIDALILSTIALLSFFSLMYLFAVSSIGSPIGSFLFYASIIILCLPQLGFFVYLFVKFYRRRRPVQWMQDKFALFKKHCCATVGKGSDISTVEGTELQDESLPDRMVHPEQYYGEMEDRF